MKTERQQKAATWAVLPLLLWMLIGGVFAPRSGSAMVSSLNPHLACFCRMCKGGKMACCCTPATAKCFVADCDAADDSVTGPAAALSVLPPVPVSAVLPSATDPILTAAPVRAQTAATRTPSPLFPPPKTLS